MTQLRKGSVLLPIGTSRGAFVFRTDARRKRSAVYGPLQKDLIIHHFTFGPRDRETMKSKTNQLPFGSPRLNARLQEGFRSIMRQPPGGLHGAEV